MTDQARIEETHELDPGTYVFEVSPGPVGGTLTLEDGTEIQIGKEGGRESIRIREPQKIVISYLADGHPPAGIELKRIR